MSRRVSRDNGVPFLWNQINNTDQSCLGKRSRCENRVSQDYSHCDDLAGLESTNPALEYFERYSESLNQDNSVHAKPTLIVADVASLTSSSEATNATVSSSVDSSYPNQCTVTSNLGNFSDSNLRKPSSIAKDAWGWFVNGGDEDTFN